MNEPVDWELARLASLQHGCLTRGQLLAALSAAVIDHRVRLGRLHRVHRGVYAVGYIAQSPRARAMAAVLACGERAVLSHRSAAALWDICPPWQGPVEVSAPGHPRHAGVRVHRSRTLEPRVTTTHHGIPVTTPARTLLDLADVLAAPALARAVNEAQVLRLVQIDDLAALVADSPGRRGTVRLRPLTERESAPTRSAFEDLFLAFAARHGLPLPEVNQRVAGYEVDMLWRPERLIVELDGRAYHDHDRPFEHDRDKDADLLAAGYATVRVTWRRLVDQPGREAARLASLLGAGREAWRAANAG